MSTYGVVLFYTTSSVMRAEKVLKKADINVKLIPTPRELSSDCGIALRFDWEQAESIEAILDEAHVEIAGVYEI
jgi:hypothetical protein